MKKKRVPYVSFDKYLKEELKNPKFREAFERAGERLEIVYAIAEMRNKARLTQKEMAKKLKMSQSAVARIEQGGQNLTLGTLWKIADCFGKKLKVKFE
jgi:DNA-binding XRE family transcriptional regulator